MYCFQRRTSFFEQLVFQKILRILSLCLQFLNFKGNLPVSRFSLLFFIVSLDEPGLSLKSESRILFQPAVNVFRVFNMYFKYFNILSMQPNCESPCIWNDGRKSANFTCHFASKSVWTYYSTYLNMISKISIDSRTGKYFSMFRAQFIAVFCFVA